MLQIPYSQSKSYAFVYCSGFQNIVTRTEEYGRKIINHFWLCETEISTFRENLLLRHRQLMWRKFLVLHNQ